MIAALALQAAAFGPYTDVKLEGWTVRTESALMQDALWPPVKRELENQLYRIGRVLPDGPLAKLRHIVFWVYKDDPGSIAMAFHPDAGWLREHHLNPDMAHGVELGNAKNFLSWTYEQPWMALHELAHAYHHEYLKDGFENKDIKAVWDAAMGSKRYDSVLHWNGENAKHYGENNPMEYFAECTEAYFGRNDFYPFVNAELKTFDPDAFKLMQRVWGNPQKRP
jgi:hypothetical protein